MDAQRIEQVEQVEQVGRVGQVDHLLARVRAEFLEMPCLTLTLPQAMRLWHLDLAACRAVLGSLVRARFLVETRQGAFRRLEG
jgi:hypothetical protein